MPFTTAPRPLDIAALWPELAELARTAVRLHPRPGEPTADQSSIGGPLLWPENEPWPTCTEEHAWDIDTLIAASGEVRPLRAEGGAETSMIPLAQMFGSDVPELPFASITDLLQVLWCPWDHPATHTWHPKIEIRWRSTTDPQLRPQHAPSNTGSDKHYVPRPCVLSPETVTEYPDYDDLPPGLMETIEELEGDEDLIGYRSSAIAPGWKTGGWVRWALADSMRITCACGAEGKPLFTIPSGEWDAGDTHWRPVEEQDPSGPDARSFDPVGVFIGRGYRLQVFHCGTDPTHAPVTVMT